MYESRLLWADWFCVNQLGDPEGGVGAVEERVSMESYRFDIVNAGMA